VEIVRMQIVEINYVYGNYVRQFTKILPCLKAAGILLAPVKQAASPFSPNTL
jgi:hypothetical protein